jgi:putative chitinase
MSEAMKLLQMKIGVTADGSFGPNTARAIAKHYELSPNRGAHLLGQSHHESGGFKRTTEGLYYSTPERIQAVWPSRFPTVESAEPYAKNPQGLANKVYNGRMGNAEGSNDGFAFAGKGFLQLTGKSNVRAFAADMKLPEVLEYPSKLADEYAFETALWFFQKNGLFAIADDGVSDESIKRITRRVNGGYHGLEDRINQTRKIHTWLLT